jgi:hypothetical protein
LDGRTARDVLRSYPRRLRLRRGFDVARSISQNIQTRAVPRLATTPRNTSVSSGAVNMFNIPDVKQAAYQQTQSTTASMQQHRGRIVHSD